MNLEGDLGGAGGGVADVPVEPGNVPEPVVTDPTPTIQVGEAEYTLEQLQDALNSHDTRETWTKEHGQKTNELNTMAKAVEASYQGAMGRQPQAAQPAQEPAQLTPEAFRDLLWDDPAKAMGIMQDMMRSTSVETNQTAETERVFYEKHSDYNEVVTSPEFQAFRAGLPGHSDVTAYFEYKLEQSQTNAAQFTDEQKQKMEAELLENLRVKGLLGTTLKGPGAAPQPAHQGGPATPAQARTNAIDNIHQGRAAKGMAP